MVKTHQKFGNMAEFIESPIMGLSFRSLGQSSLLEIFREWSYGVPKIAMFEILQCTEMGK